MQGKPVQTGDADLKRVIDRNQQHVKSVAAGLGKQGVGKEAWEKAPLPVLEDVLRSYQDMRMRVLEIEKVRKVLGKRHGRNDPPDVNHAKLLEDLDGQIRLVTEWISRRSAAPAPPPPPAAAMPFDRWLREEEDSVTFTAKARLIEDLAYSTTPAVEAARAVERSGRGFTLISLRGPAPALDAILPGLQVREHDILERYSATEIRGVLTHLRPVSEQEIARVIRRFLAAGYSDVKCLFIGIQSPDQIDDTFLVSLEQVIAEMQPGESRSSNIASLF